MNESCAPVLSFLFRFVSFLRKKRKEELKGEWVRVKSSHIFF